MARGPSSARRAGPGLLAHILVSKYDDYLPLYRPDALTGAVRVREAACWAHLRREFHDIWKSTGSAIAEEALKRIGALYDIERQVSGQPAELRLALRQEQSKPKVEAFKAWLEALLGRLSQKSELAKAMRYGLKRWQAFTLFLEDGRVAIDSEEDKRAFRWKDRPTNSAERAIRPVSLGRKNFLFAGSHVGGETLADALSIIETAKLCGFNPGTYLADLLARINDHPVNRIEALLPWN